MTKAINEREIVLEVLLEITEHGMYSHIVLRLRRDRAAF